MQKASSGLLSSTKLASTIGVATSAVELAPPHPDGLLRFGDTVMLSSALGGALCGNTNDRLQLNQEAYQLSGWLRDQKQTLASVRSEHSLKLPTSAYAHCRVRSCCVSSGEPREPRRAAAALLLDDRAGGQRDA
eukprot:6178064-Pleurochrysis_carterae.AAC.5